MLKNLLGGGIALTLLAMLALPFGREAYYRHVVSQQIVNGLDAADRAAFANWNGSALSFVDALRERCTRVEGDPHACDRYRMAAQ